MLLGLSIKHFYLSIIAIIYAIIIIVFYIKVTKDNEFKNYFLESISENNKISGKSLTGFYFVQIIGLSTIVAVIYSPNHLLPEYYLISLLTFVGGLYGFKLASKYISDSGSQTTMQTDTPKTDTNQTTTKENTTQNNNTKPEDIG